MEAKEVRGLMEAYASVYEKYDHKKKKKVMHDCATHGEHVKWGVGVMIKEMHTLDEEGNITHYDVEFEHGIERNVPVQELTILEGGMHEHYINDEKNAELIEDQKESVDLFDYLLEYLVAEGYADTNKAALAIMLNMSEEWKQSIVEAMISEDYGDPLGKIPKLKAEIEIANLKRQRNQQNAASQLRSGSYGVPSYARSQEMDAESRHNEAGLTKAQSRQILAQNRRDLEAAAGLKPGSTEKDAWYNDPNYGKDLDGKMKFFSPRTVLAKQGGVEGKLTVDPNTGKKTFAAGAFTDAEKARYTSKGGK